MSAYSPVREIHRSQSQELFLFRIHLPTFPCSHVMAETHTMVETVHIPRAGDDIVYTCLSGRPCFLSLIWTPTLAPRRSVTA